MMAIIMAILMISGLVTMAARRRRRRASLQPLKFTVDLALVALASGAAISVATIDSLEQDFDIVSTHMTLSIRNHTAGEGSIDVGLSEQGYTNAEIVEALDASPLSQYGTAWERSNRKVRLYGTFAGLDTEEVLNDGESVAKRMFIKGFAHSTFAVARVWARNTSGSVLTTGTVLHIQGTHWGRWK